MKHRSHLCREEALPTCENCVHTIRNKVRPDEVVCIPHLKSMPAHNTTVCELHVLRTRTN